MRLMVSPMRFATTALFFSFAMTLMLMGVVRADEPTYGVLAPGALSVSEQSQVKAEICRDLLIAPSDANARLPPGYRLLRARELAKEDPKLEALLVATPALGEHVMGSLCFMLVGRFEIDGTRAISEALPSPMAFWWARAERTGLPDPRMQGKSQWVQLASWYADEGTDRALIRKTDPMAAFIPLTVVETKPGVWNARLTHAGETVEASVEVSGEPQKRKTPQPGFMTVPSSGDHSHYFTVFTYFGHHHQTAVGTWTASGGGVFSNAFRISGEAEAFGTHFQNRWQARAALYEFAR